MSSLTGIDRIKLEKFLEMGGGYVCDFTDRTFGTFVEESVGKNIHAETYSDNGTSKAKKLRQFWKKEPDEVVYRLNEALLDYWNTYKQEYPESHGTTYDPNLYRQCIEVNRKLNSLNLGDASVFKGNAEDVTFVTLANSIADSVRNNKPSESLDRLHTFTTRYLREICMRHEIEFNKDTALHSLMGSYIKKLKASKTLDSEMSERILKNSISLLEAFNDVRNNKSLAHDNEILNHAESVLIFNMVSNMIRFINSIEEKVKSKSPNLPKVSWVDLKS